MTTDPSAASAAGHSGCGSAESCSHDRLLEKLREEVITAKAAKERSEAALAFSEASLKQLEEVKKKTDAAKDAYEKGLPDLQRQLKELLGAVSRERCACIVSPAEDRTLIEKIREGTKSYRDGLNSCRVALTLQKIDASARLQKATFWADEAQARVDEALKLLAAGTTKLGALVELKKRVEATGGDSAACRYAFCLDLIERACGLQKDLTSVSDYECELVRLTECVTRRRDRVNQLTGEVREIDSRIELVESLRKDLADNWLQRLCAAVGSGCSPRFPDSLFPTCCGTRILDDCSRVDPEAPDSDGGAVASPKRPPASPDDPCSEPCGADTPKPCAEKPSDPCAEKPADPCAEKPTDPCAEKPTDPCAEKPTDPGAEKPADPCTDTPTDPSGGGGTSTPDPCAATKGDEEGKQDGCTESPSPEKPAGHGEAPPA